LCVCVHKTWIEESKHRFIICHALGDKKRTNLSEAPWFCALFDLPSNLLWRHEKMFSFNCIVQLLQREIFFNSNNWLLS
jgi:hypothetical protein